MARLLKRCSHVTRPQFQPFPTPPQPALSLFPPPRNLDKAQSGISPFASVVALASHVFHVIIHPVLALAVTARMLAALSMLGPLHPFLKRKRGGGKYVSSPQRVACVGGGGGPLKGVLRRGR